MRSLLFCLLISLSNIAFTQEGIGDLTVIPAVSRDDMKKADVHGILSEGKYVVTWIGGSKAGGDMRYDVYERDTKSHVKTVKRPWPGLFHNIVKMLEHNGSTYLITLDWANKTKQLEIKAQEYAFPEFEPVGEARLLGTIKHQPMGVGPISGRPLRFFHSPSGQMILMTYGSVNDKNDFVGCWVLGEGLGTQQTATIELANASDIRNGFQGAVVTDKGDAYILLQASFTDENQKELGARLYKVADGTVTSMNVELPPNAELTSAYLAPMKDELMVGGFYKLKGTQGGRFHTSVQHDHTGSLPVKTIPFTEETAEFNKCRVLVREDGGAFLIGNAAREEAVPKKGMNVSSIGPAGELEWSTMIPRKIGPLWTIKDGFIAVVRDDQLLLLLPDTPENLERLKKGEDPAMQIGSVRGLRALTALFDNNGIPTFTMLGGPEYKVFFDDMQTLHDGHTVFQHISPIESKQDRNVAYAIIDLSK